jgi:SAM-dependent methyltransferase
VEEKNVSKALVEKIVRPFVPQIIKDIRRSFLSLRPITPRHCPLCGFDGWFGHYGRPPRIDAQCSQCGSLERHRLLFLALQTNQIRKLPNLSEEPILHFAPEKELESYLRRSYPQYQTADLLLDADLQLNLESINIPDNTYGLIIANHVLEHVDDYKATMELKRILKANGMLIVMVPIIEGWDETYENESATTRNERWVHFGHVEHIRYYGRDFRERVEKSGLNFSQEITAAGDNVIKYALLRGEKIFIFIK